jgi:hypothetical protein
LIISYGSRTNFTQHVPHCPNAPDEPNSLETQKYNIWLEFKQALDELKKASETSAQELLNILYEKHPLTRGKRSMEPTIKSRFKAVFLNYHPDKQDLEKDGLKWMVMSQEITVLLTHHFERIRSVMVNFLRG